MESSIAKFLWRQPACERLPTTLQNLDFAAQGRIPLSLRCAPKLVAAAYFMPTIRAFFSAAAAGAKRG